MKTNAQPQGAYVREYMSRINEMYTDYMSRALRKNIDKHGFEQVESDMKRPISIPFKDEPGVYAIEFESDDDEPMVQIGSSNNGPAGRFSFHKRKGKNHRLTRWEPHVFPESLETDIQMLMSPHKTPCRVDLTKKRKIYCSKETFYNKADYHGFFDKSLKKSKELQQKAYPHNSPVLSPT